jgi:hypothetical protein
MVQYEGGFGQLGGRTRTNHLMNTPRICRGINAWEEPLRDPISFFFSFCLSAVLLCRDKCLSLVNLGIIIHSILMFDPYHNPPPPKTGIRGFAHRNP